MLKGLYCIELETSIAQAFQFIEETQGVSDDLHELQCFDSSMVPNEHTERIWVVELNKCYFGLNNKTLKHSKYKIELYMTYTSVK